MVKQLFDIIVALVIWEVEKKHVPIERDGVKLMLDSCHDLYYARNCTKFPFFTFVSFQIYFRLPITN